MANICLPALRTLKNYLLGNDGINQKLVEIAARDEVTPLELRERDVLIRHVTPEVAEANSIAYYPSIFLYCMRIENAAERKFARFAGHVTLAADLRVSGERLERIDGEAARLAEAFTCVLEERQGQWTDHLLFDGRFKTDFQPVRVGGINFLQTAKIEIDVIAHV